MRIRLLALALVLIASAGGAAASAASASASTVTVTGQVFADENANGKADAGEGLRGARVVLGDAEKEYRVTTGASGRFSLSVPPGSYYVDGGGRGWTLIQRFPTVGKHGATLNLRAVRPLGKVLSASMHFTKTRYAVGDKAHLVVTLRNTGTKPLRGISAACDRAGDPDEVSSIGPNWGRLAEQGPGITLASHQARTFPVVTAVTAAAHRSGQIVAACDFGYPGLDSGYRPEAEALAKVPGEFGALAATVAYFRHGHSGPTTGLPGVRFVLVDPTTCPLVKRVVKSGPKGNFRFSHVPAGSSYKLYAFPPKGWKIEGKNPSSGLVFGQDTTEFGFIVEHGTGRAPTVPTHC